MSASTALSAMLLFGAVVARPTRRALPRFGVRKILPPGLTMTGLGRVRLFTINSTGSYQMNVLGGVMLTAAGPRRRRRRLDRRHGGSLSGPGLVSGAKGHRSDSNRFHSRARRLLGMANYSVIPYSGTRCYTVPDGFKRTRGG